jgi:cell wall-associated NlpC family hydrolase
MHWATQYIGKKWVACGRGPEGFDCWGLVHWASREHYGRELPDFALHPDHKAEVAKLMTEQAASGKWRRLASPEDGCVVAMSSSAMIHHVGIYLATDGGVILHAHERYGVVAQTVNGLRTLGWTRIEFYKWQPSS